MSLGLRVPRTADWKLFYQLAAAENWRIPAMEKYLLQTLWPMAALTLQQDDRFCGLITAVRHQHSAWIGNLLVPAEQRRRGHGSRLFTAVLAMLQADDVARIWLTASEQGRPLYERMGFVAVDRIERWIRLGGAGGQRPDMRGAGSAADLLAADRQTWGENREPFLGTLISHGRLLTCDGAVALLQPGDDCQVLGPWYAPPTALVACRRLLLIALAAADPTVDLVIDLRASSAVAELLVEAGFVRTSENLLMASGSLAAVNLREMVALASLGSVG